jgi:hypothetical protein
LAGLQALEALSGVIRRENKLRVRIAPIKTSQSLSGKVEKHLPTSKSRKTFLFVVSGHKLGIGIYFCFRGCFSLLRPLSPLSTSSYFATENFRKHSMRTPKEEANEVICARL